MVAVAKQVRAVEKIMTKDTGLVIDSPTVRSERQPDGRVQLKPDGRVQLKADGRVQLKAGAAKAPPPPPPCPPVVPSEFQIRWQAIDNYGFVPGLDVTRTYTLTNMPYCNDFDSYPCTPTDDTPSWVRSFSPEWCAYWGCDPCPTANCPNNDTGDWCESQGRGPWEVHVVAYEPACVFTTVNMRAWPRFGTVNGNTGWHVLLYGYGDNSNGCGANTCPSDFFPHFDRVTGISKQNFFLGSTLNGVVSGVTQNGLCPPGVWPGRWTLIWTFSS